MSNEKRSAVRSLTFTALVALLAAAGAVAASAPASAGVSVGVDLSWRVSGPAPFARYEVRTPCPGREQVWIAGYWDWRHDYGRYDWMPGRWERRPFARAVWVPSRHEHRGGAWYYQRGHWR